jgi:hypothetical protein
MRKILARSKGGCWIRKVRWLRLDGHGCCLNMAELREWIEEEISERRMEPNGGLGQTFRYVLNHWEGLTRFLTVAGVTLSGASAKSMRLSAAWRFPTDDGVDVCDVAPRQMDDTERISKIHSSDRFDQSRPLLFNFSGSLHN